MDYAVDLYRMKVISAINSDKKVRWDQFALLAVLSNHPKIKEYISNQISLFSYKGIFSRFVKVEKKPKGLIRLPYKSPKYLGINDILTTILNEIKFNFSELAVHGATAFNVNEEKAVCLNEKEDIHFKLQFAHVSVDKDKGKQDVANEQNKVLDMNNCCGIVYSYTRTTEEVFKFISDKYCVQKVKDHAILRSIVVMRVTKIKKKMIGTWDTQHVSKNFTNVFLEEDVKKKVMNQIQRFENEHWYIDRGIPRTLGILLHGRPGCGKTSIIKAFACHFNRRILIIDFKLVKTWKHLRTVFSQIMTHEEGEEMGKMFCYHTETIYVLEDFDCMTSSILSRNGNGEEEKEVARWAREKKKKMKKDLERRRKIMEKFAPKAKSGKELENMMKGKGKSKNILNSSEDEDEEDDKTSGQPPYEYKQEDSSDDDDDDNRVTLSNFLEILDGIIEMHGRIIIMTTNMRDKVDSALIRPGRIDLDLELCPPSLEVMKDIFYHMYKGLEHDILDGIWKEYSPRIAKDGKYSTAQVMNAYMYINPEDGMKALM